MKKCPEAARVVIGREGTSTLTKQQQETGDTGLERKRRWGVSTIKNLKIQKKAPRRERLMGGRKESGGKSKPGQGCTENVTTINGCTVREANPIEGEALQPENGKNKGGGGMG